MTNHRRTTMALGLVAACATLAACGSSKSNSGLNQAAPTAPASSAATSAATPTSTSSASTASSSPSASSSASAASPVAYASSPDPTDPTTAAVLKAYKAYSDVKVTMFDQAAVSNQLRFVAATDAVQGLTDATGQMRQDGVHYAGRPTSKPSVTSVAGDTATVQDCFGSSTWFPVYSVGPNVGKSAVPAGSPVSAHPITATLKQLNGMWLVTDAVTKPEPC